MPKGIGLPLLRRLSEELGIVTATLHSARGFSGGSRPGVFDRLEKDVLAVVVEEDRSDEVFLWLYQEARVSTEKGRLLLVAPLRGATPFQMPEGVAWEHG
jgi:hypothetical protein